MHYVLVEKSASDRPTGQPASSNAIGSLVGAHVRDYNTDGLTKERETFPSQQIAYRQ